MLCPQTETISQSPRLGRPATVAVTIAMCDGILFQGGVPSYVGPGERIRRIQNCARNQLGLRHPPSKRSIQEFYKERGPAANRWWRHHLLAIAFPRAFPTGFVAAHLTAKARDSRILAECERILNDGNAGGRTSLPSEQTIRRFLEKRDAARASAR